ncbi:outer membrane protein/protective antigen OMA87-like protein [Fibrella aestuarina BUZ 2]|uniref:Outer membrane protein/protective antigen OMA87-like protein n=2 Tax=Fibrella TaxID=861914 RepID=I0KG08_9BACT|nr:outer membrane protein/protective antigen OMA87-like protein [Fibrella aestuarina BUZ 2]
MSMYASLLLTTLLSCTPPDSTAPPKRFSLLPLPVVYYTPETRLGYGVAATATFRFRGDTARYVRPSQVTLGAVYTQNKQLLFYLPFQIFYKNNLYFANGELGYYKYNYFFFGVGQRDVPNELYGVNFPRVRVNVFRRISKPDASRPGRGLYAGLRYQYEHYAITSVTPDGLLATGNVPGGLGSVLSGVGTGLFFDSRNNVFYPSQGLVADLSFLSQGKAVGSGVRFDRWVADVSSYHSLTRRTTLAFNYVLSVTTGGVAPFNALSLLGGTKRGRGYYEGRYRDDNLALLQGELRLNVWRRLGAVAFGSVGTLGNQRDFLRLDDPKAAYGVGLRVRVNRDLLNVRLDYGRGVPYTGTGSSGVYLTIGEAF